MKKIFCIIICFSITQKIIGQTNLVPNPGFESYTYCPTAMGAGGLNNWENYSFTPDYYNSCANASTSYLGVPSNLFGWQNAADGNGYTGLLTFNMYGQREVLGVQLTQTLSIGTKYYVSFYTSRPDTSNYTYGFRCIHDKLGARFSTKKFSTSNPVPINNFAHVFSTIQINDTLGWTKISGTFVSDSNYTHLMLGNFFDNVNTNYTGCSTSNSTIFAYYYLDKVCVSTDSTLCNVPTQIKNFPENNTFTIYPNPTSGNVFIKMPYLKTITNLKITDRYSQVVFVKTNFKETEIDMTNFSDGLYFIQVISDGKTFNEKIVVQH